MTGRSFTAMLAVALACWPAAGAAAAADKGVEEVAGAGAEFAFRLYAAAGRRQDQNLLLSPYGVSEAFAMAYAGSRGRTAEQLANALGFSPDQGAFHPAFSRLKARLGRAQGKGARLLAANSLWPQKGHGLLDEYLSLVRMYYGASIEAVDFAGAKAGALRAINAWIERATEGRFKDFLQPSALPPKTRLVLASAAYFKGAWDVRFDAGRTSEMPFMRLSGRPVKAMMMSRLGRFKLGDLPDAQVLELPYAGRGFSMLVVLPKDPRGLAALERGLGKDSLGAWTASLRSRDARVLFPRFRLGSRFSLVEALRGMGLKDAFLPDQADFSGMDGGKGRLYLGAALHAAMMDVDEEGAEAAGASAGAGDTGLPAAPAEFEADHPFLFLIRETSTGAVLLIGRLADPEAADFR